MNIEKYAERQRELLESISNISGAGEWVLEVDWLANATKLPKHDAERIGDTYIDQVLSNIESLFKNKLEGNETMKEAFNEATPNRTISIVINDKQNSYFALAIKDGGLQVSHKLSIANIHEISYYDLASITPIPGIISLVAKLNLEEKRPKLEEYVERIKTATGEEFTFDESSLQPFYEKLEENYRKRIGDLVYNEILPNVTELIERNMKDEMVKEAFLEVVTNRQIILQINPKQKVYWDVKFENGNFVLSSNGSICNVHEISYFNIEKLL